MKKENTKVLNLQTGHSFTVVVVFVFVVIVCCILLFPLLFFFMVGGRLSIVDGLSSPLSSSLSCLPFLLFFFNR